MQLRRKSKIVFDGVGRAQNLGIFASDDGADQFNLHIKWQAGGKAIHIKLVGLYAFRF